MSVLTKATRRAGLLAVPAVLATGLAIVAGGSAGAAGSAHPRSPQAGGAVAPGLVHGAAVAGVGKPSTVVADVCNGGPSLRTYTLGTNTPQVFTGSTPSNLSANPLWVLGPKVGRSTLLLTFTAETQLRGVPATADYDWIEGIMTVDGVPVTDVGASQLALSGSATYQSNAYQACVKIGPGWHRIMPQVAITTFSGTTGESAWIDDWKVRADVLK